MQGVTNFQVTEYKMHVQVDAVCEVPSLILTSSLFGEPGLSWKKWRVKHQVQQQRS